MPHLHDIVTFINDKVKLNSLSGAVYQLGQYNGIAQTLPRFNKDGVEELLPCIVSNDDENRWVGIDDIYPIIIYHKNGGINTIPDPKFNYGQGQNIMSETATMQMIVYGDRARLEITPEDLYGAIVGGFPRTIDKATVLSWQLRMASVKGMVPNFNSRQIYQTEYGNSDYKLPPNKILFQISYTIATRYNQTCFALCAA